MKPKILPPPAFKFNVEDNDRIIYFCGPHGVGKSTFVNDLRVFGSERIREQLTHYDALQENVTRQIWRTALHCIEHRENLNYIKKLPSKAVLIGDRCFLDDYAYVNAFLRLGWMTKKECSNIFEITDDIYLKSNTPKPTRFVVLMPPLQWNIDRIEERWHNGEEPKWCELNFDYLQEVRTSFEEAASKFDAKVIRLTDRKDRILEFKHWLNKCNLEDFIVEGRIFVESPVGTGS